MLASCVCPQYCVFEAVRATSNRPGLSHSTVLLTRAPNLPPHLLHFAARQNSGLDEIVFHKIADEVLEQLGMRVHPALQWSNSCTHVALRVAFSVLAKVQTTVQTC